MFWVWLVWQPGAPAAPELPAPPPVPEEPEPPPVPWPRMPVPSPPVEEPEPEPPLAVPLPPLLPVEQLPVVLSANAVGTANRKATKTRSPPSQIDLSFKVFLLFERYVGLVLPGGVT